MRAGISGGWAAMQSIQNARRANRWKERERGFRIIDKCVMTVNDVVEREVVYKKDRAKRGSQRGRVPRG